MKLVYERKGIFCGAEPSGKLMAEKCFAAYKTSLHLCHNVASIYEIDYCDINLLLREAGHGNDEVMLELGYMFENGIIFEADAQKAFYWYEKGAKLGNADCQLALFYMYRFSGVIENNVYKAIFWLKQATEGGNAVAMFILGQVFIDGLIEEIDIRKGLYWIERAALKGYCNAMLYLGDIAEKGIYDDADMCIAYKWYLKAARQSSAEAYMMLAQLVFGEFADNDAYIKKAVYYLKKAAKLGIVEADFMLGAYYKSLGENYYRKAFTHLKRAADSGKNILAIFEVAEMYELGQGTRANGDKAYEYYSKVLDLM